MTPAPIPPTAFRQMRDELQLSQSQLAALMGFGSKQAVANYEGTRSAHGPIALAMRLLVDRHRHADMIASADRIRPLLKQLYTQNG